MNLVAITTPYFYQGEPEAIVKALTVGGFNRVHIRKPDADASAIRSLIEAIPIELRPRLSVHDHFESAAELNIGGVHLNSRNPVPPAGWNGLVSRSLHSISEIGNCKYDYAFLSPVFPSISKQGYLPAFTIDEAKPHLNNRIYALGGVTPEKMALLEAAGFGGAAMLGAAWSKPVDTEAFKLQFITHPTAALSVPEGAHEALKGGCRWIQLRHKDASAEQLVAEGEECRKLCDEYGAAFIVDDHVELVGRLGADGVHLGKNDMPIAKARSILGPSKIIGATANTFDDIANAANQGADYIGLGPFRFTTTKKNLSPILGTDGYRNIVAQCRRKGITLPIVAIGGITDADIPGIMAAGINGIALSSSILQADDSAAQTAATLCAIKAQAKTRHEENQEKKQ